MWKCKKCGEEVVMIETVNITSTYTISKNYENKKRKLKYKEKGLEDTGYVCSNIDCEKNEEYSQYLTDIAYWED